ncbi:ABC transporter substrate-binding protein [uncultured Massilia sp.]|uniref:substrate-binding periplasmic protein n=1 Tax=uncultured Massilia sp. TaxID=169973 RepID=UPI0025E2C185|nr:transporter substrate-binding domain-containing protein [uncultured Massilia sp.]
MKTTILAALLAAACLHAQAAPALYITTEISAPFAMYEAGRVVGIGTDTVREIMARTGTAYTIDLLPWKRAYMAALDRPNGCVYSTTRTPEREATFKWIGPIGEADWILVGRADRSFSLRTLEDARGYRIGTYNGDARDQYLRARGFDVDPATDDQANPRKLIMNRVDLWAASIIRGLPLDRLGYGNKLAPVLTFNTIRVYLACNRAMPDAMVARMNEALATMERDGSLRAIQLKYDDWGRGR